MPTLSHEKQAMATRGKAARGAVFLKSFVLHENSSKAEVQLRHSETIGHLGGRLQAVKRGNAALPRLAVECIALPWVARRAEATTWVPGFVATSEAERFIEDNGRDDFGRNPAEDADGG